MVVERKQKLFRNQWTNWNNLKAYRSWTFIKTRITVVGNSLALEPQLSRYCSGWLNISFCSEIREQLIQYRVQCTLYTVANTYLYRVYLQILVSWTQQWEASIKNWHSRPRRNALRCTNRCIIVLILLWVLAPGTTSSEYWLWVLAPGTTSCAAKYWHHNLYRQVLFLCRPKKM